MKIYTQNALKWLYMLEKNYVKSVNSHILGTVCIHWQSVILNIEVEI